MPCGRPYLGQQSDRLQLWASSPWNVCGLLSDLQNESSDFSSSLLKKGALGFSTHLQRTNQHSGSSSPQTKLRSWKPKSPLTTAGPPPHSCGYEWVFYSEPQAQVSTPHPQAELALTWRFTSPTDTEALVSVYQQQFKLHL